MNIKSAEVRAYRIPTATPEEDGTAHWDSTTMVYVEVTADTGQKGIGFSYASAAAGDVIREMLIPAITVTGGQVEDTGQAWEKMVARVRNAGRLGVASTAISAVDIALWDLKAKAAGLPLFRLLGAHRQAVPVYGSGGFCNYTNQQLADQFESWARQGITRFKMKIGRDWGTRPENDLQRVKFARQVIGAEAELFVDANGGYSAKQAVRLGQQFAEYGVTYFEEPVSSDQLEQLAFVRVHVPEDVAAGEYGYDPWYFRDMLRAGAVDIQQADATRCLGVTGFLQAAALAYGFDTPFSAHTSPSIHAQAGCAVPQLSHVEYFFDHERIEHMLFDGAPSPVEGYLHPDPDRPGLGLELKQNDAKKWRV